tara:strand:- start:814 stop:1461 length:648 start_codon:yes stop_codon:yes gene_type:complete
MSLHIVHRGIAKKNFKENTINSFKYCFSKNYGIETDLHCSKDNKIVCFHDFNLKNKFKINKYVNKINYNELLHIGKKNKNPIPLLKDLVKLSKKKYYLMLEIKPIFSKQNLKLLINETKNLKKYSITSFKVKNLVNLYSLNKKLNLGLLVPSTWTINKIIKKSKLKYVKFLILEKKFLPSNKLYKINKEIFYYTIKKKELFKKYEKSKNLIFENL